MDEVEEKIEKLNFYIGELWVSSFSSSSSKSCTTMWRLYFVSSVVTKLHLAHANFGSWVCCFFFREILKDDFVVALGVSGLDSGRTWDDDELLGVSCEVTPPPLDFISTTLEKIRLQYNQKYFKNFNKEFSTLKNKIGKICRKTKKTEKLKNHENWRVIHEYLNLRFREKFFKNIGKFRRK